MENKEILVSVCITTYNQQEYIAQTIEGAIMQKTNFPFEIIIGEDCGTDKTREICIAYQKKYPELIKLDLHETNIGPQRNLERTFKQSKGKYIALCEGDDYWIDENKLQKQCDFMESNPDYSMCAHGANILMFDKFEPTTIDKETLTIDDIILMDWSLMTASLFFRADAYTYPKWFPSIINDDYAIQLIVSLKGKTRYLPHIMSVYRRHQNGVSATLKPFEQTAAVIKLLYHFNKHTSYKYNKLIRKKVKRVYKNQIEFAKEYRLRKATLVLSIFKILSPVSPFLIRHLSK